MYRPVMVLGNAGAGTVVTGEATGCTGVVTGAAVDVVDVTGVVTGAVDAGALDAGAVDAGALDAGTLDAGTLDAGVVETGAADAANVDRAGCEDAAGFEEVGAGDGVGADVLVLLYCQYPTPDAPDDRNEQTRQHMQIMTYSTVLSRAILIRTNIFTANHCGHRCPGYAGPEGGQCSGCPNMPFDFCQTRRI